MGRRGVGAARRAPRSAPGDAGLRAGAGRRRRRCPRAGGARNRPDARRRAVGGALGTPRASGRAVAGAVLILGIETATQQVSVAIGGHEGVIGLFETSRGRRHAETLVPAIDFLCDRADIGLEDIAVVAVDVGPGLFTGMRVGLATAKALALALRVPMIGISSLDLLAFPHRRADRLVVPVVDARKDEVFYAMYRPVPGGIQQVVPPR